MNRLEFLKTLVAIPAGVWAVSNAPITEPPMSRDEMWRKSLEMHAEDMERAFLYGVKDDRRDS